MGHGAEPGDMSGCREAAAFPRGRIKPAVAPPARSVLDVIAGQHRLRARGAPRRRDVVYPRPTCCVPRLAPSAPAASLPSCRGWTDVTVP